MHITPKLLYLLHNHHITRKQMLENSGDVMDYIKQLIYLCKIEDDIAKEVAEIDKQDYLSNKN